VWLLAAARLSAAPITAEDVQDIFRSVVTVESRVPSDARTAAGLGRERRGAGVVIDENGLVLTIGYLILEATSVSVTDVDGRRLPAEIVAYDHETGFGLVRALLPMDIKPIEIGRSGAVLPGDPVLALGGDGPRLLTPQRVADRRPFAGYWEYLLENAILTTPPHPGFGGAPLIDIEGKLVGIGSLYVGDAMRGPPPIPGNMFVPIDLLEPIFADLLENGRRTAPAQPWLGVNVNETGGRVFVTRVMDGSPAESAGVKSGDIIMGVGGRAVHGMIDFFRKVRDQGGAGTDIPVDILSAESTDLSIDRRTIHSRNRIDWLGLKKGF
jgi:S1-C subfamily serine protease